jgi:hypothetical protein
MGVLRAKLQAIATGNKTQLVAGLTVFGDGCNDYNRAPGSATRRQYADVV